MARTSSDSKTPCRSSSATISPRPSVEIPRLTIPPSNACSFATRNNGFGCTADGKCQVSGEETETFNVQPTDKVAHHAPAPDTCLPAVASAKAGHPFLTPCLAFCSSFLAGRTWHRALTQKREPRELKR